MSRNADVMIEWGGGQTLFRLGIGELEKLDDALDCGPAHLLEKIRTGTWRVKDLRETLRWGLIGGGLTPPEAAKQLALYFDGRPLMEAVLPAQAILIAVLAGAPDEPVGGDDDGPKEVAANHPSQEEKSGSPHSTKTES